ncbi:sulfatase-like hydrolase/transferase [Flagellimonas sp. CMM7]|uniref:sulfatase-like hydrolase/transferase n=1 Tax=Flagellimonas sp. CMM7 TaxID=2654676 RepID=UPI0013D5DF80|nr:sulfatase-like hydrolase/transferase [Flagellimonas sp. CMM7]UII80628.1 sulfatase-like hydrolase/transferase [Flagellimonas sp. CMM7]
MKKPILYLTSLIFCLVSLSGFSQKKPNVVLIFPDNLGVGEVAAYGGARGVPTPNIDRIGAEGIRLTNFNVEYSCTPSRIAILTGRYAVRAGEDYYAGTTLWEETIAERLKSVGYSTALFGKWDLGAKNWHGKREPTHQGFDEWYGIPGTTHVSQFPSMEGFDPSLQPAPYIWEGNAGTVSKKVKPFNQKTRRTIDREAAERSIAFIKKNAEKDKPFFLYYAMTQLHFPALPHPDKAGTTGAGDMGDSMADVDYNVGLILNQLKELGIEDNTLIIWCTDNGAEMRRPWRGSPGPWRGYYNSAMEGGIRTPCVIRWPDRIKAGQVSNEMVHEVDLFSTIINATGKDEAIPKDRIIDGINQLPFLEGKQSKSNRESAIFTQRFGQIMAVKWRDWKLWYVYKTEMPDPEPENQVRLFDLRVDPREEIDVKDYYPGVIGIMDSIVKEYEASFIKHPRVSATANAVDPYLPPEAGSGSPVKTYERTDRTTLEERSSAMKNPDFSGTWSTTVLHRVSVINRVDEPPVPSLGSGWGDKISIKHVPNQLDVERVVFVPREIQQLVRYHFALDGSKSENNILMGRTGKPIVSTSSWKDDRLIITSSYPFQDSKSGKWLTSKVTQTLWLQPAKGTPWESTLIVETTREGLLGGLSSTNRTVYTKGYR